METGDTQMLKIVKEVREVLEMTAGVPFAAADFIAAMGKMSADHAAAAASVIRLSAIELDCGKVVLPA
jgi:hypothetical protein